jgi:hypothetical protein
MCSYSVPTTVHGKEKAQLTTLHENGIWKDASISEEKSENWEKRKCHTWWQWTNS